MTNPPNRTLPTVRNLFDPAPAAAGESFEELAGGGAFRLERIVSRGAASPAGAWYDQSLPEWVVLVRGGATLELRDGSRLDLAAGDYLLLPAHLEHRVARASLDALWLALHFDPAAPSRAGDG